MHDVPAEIIAILYSYRRTVETFFWFYKQLMGGAHLISHSQNGIEIRVCCAMIACLLMNLWVACKRSKRTFDMICYYFTGLASEEELLAHLDKIRKAAEAAAAKNPSKRHGESCLEAVPVTDAAPAETRGANRER